MQKKHIIFLLKALSFLLTIAKFTALLSNFNIKINKSLSLLVNRNIRFDVALK